MALEAQLVIAFLVDAVVGDPRRLPHPVCGIAAVARWAERSVRRILVPTTCGAAAASPANLAAGQSLGQLRPAGRLRLPGQHRAALAEYVAGGLAVLAVLAVTVGLAGALLAAAVRTHPLAADLVGIYLVWSCLALRDLCGHARRVHDALSTGTLAEARGKVAMMVGRDTEKLSETGVAKATVESVAESFVDGVTAPLFYAALLGPLGAVGYRAINTLDSMFGYRNERYRRFGSAAAKLDDCANYVPARLSAPLLALAAGVLGHPVGSAFRMLYRDGRKHTSPNAGLPEATMAGALGIQLGGTSHYFGAPVEKPTIGDPGRSANVRDIQRANRIVTVATVLFMAVLVSSRLALTGHWANTSAAPVTERTATDGFLEPRP